MEQKRQEGIRCMVATGPAGKEQRIKSRDLFRKAKALEARPLEGGEGLLLSDEEEGSGVSHVKGLGVGVRMSRLQALCCEDAAVRAQGQSQCWVPGRTLKSNCHRTLVHHKILLIPPPLFNSGEKSL